MMPTNVCSIGLALCSWLSAGQVARRLSVRSSKGCCAMSLKCVGCPDTHAHHESWCHVRTSIRPEKISKSQDLERVKRGVYNFPRITGSNTFSGHIRILDHAFIQECSCVQSRPPSNVYVQKRASSAILVVVSKHISNKRKTQMAVQTQG